MPFTLISASRLDCAGYSLTIGNGRSTAAKTKMTLSKLHRCLGHISPAAARDIVRLGMVEGIDLDMHSKAEFCEPCARAKATRKPFPKKSLTRATQYGERVFSDVGG
ncbi:hypothetical protein B0H14DRAFT_2159352, partial [Mycena olivaceomarginata]